MKMIGHDNELVHLEPACERIRPKNVNQQLCGTFGLQ